jgi:diacylglycerol O-acyltransferase / wax synthase
MITGNGRIGRRFSGADSSWWHMEEPNNQMAITAVLILDGPLDEMRLRQLFGERLTGYDRFRQRVVDPPGGVGMPRWVDDPEFRLDRHLSRVPLPMGARRADLALLVGREMSRPLDPDRPLWRIVHVEDYQGGSALIVRVHHCIADGLALVRILLTLDDEDDNDDDSYARLLRPARSGLLGDSLALGARAVGALGRVAGMRPDPRSSLRGPLGPEKRAAWSAPLRIGDLRAAANTAGATINDVLLCGIAGGLGRFIADQGDRLGRHIRAVVPVNLRRHDDVSSLGNRFGMVFAPLPISITDPLERLSAVHQAMLRLKSSPEAGVVYGLLDVFGHTPRRVMDTVVGFFGSKASLVLTNIPGPRRRIRFCGRELVELIAWVPQSGRLGLGVSVLSYAEEVRLGVTTDATLIPRPGDLVRAFHSATDQLLEAARVPVSTRVDA